MKRYIITLRYLVVAALCATTMAACIEDVTSLNDSLYPEVEDEETTRDDSSSSTSGVAVSSVAAYFAFNGNFYDSSTNKVLLAPTTAITSTDQMTYDFDSSGLSGRAVNMNGYQMTTQALSFNSGKDFTLSVSIYPSTLSSEQSILESTLDPSKGVSLKLTDEGAVLFSLNGVEVSSEPIDFGGWNHITATYDYSEDMLTLYVDGESVNTAEVAATTSLQQLKVGATLASGTLLDEIFITSQLFDDEAVAELYDDGVSLAPITTTDYEKYLPTALAVDLTATPTGNVESASSASISVSISANIGYKRGTCGPGTSGFTDSTSNTRTYLDYISAGGANIFSAIRNIYKDGVTKYVEENENLVSFNYTYLTQEFYQDEDGSYKTRQVDTYTSACAYAVSRGLELVQQVGGIPSPYITDLDGDPLFPEDTDFWDYHTWTTTSNDYAPIPDDTQTIKGDNTKTYLEQYQESFIEWAIGCDAAIGESIGDPDYRSTWIGTQEISHTLGYYYGYTSNSTQLINDNIVRYIDYWGPISKALRANGAKTGGVQLNSSNSGYYDYSVVNMIEKGFETDYITFQFYQWGVTEDIDLAMASLLKYRENGANPNAQIYVDRGNYQKDSSTNRWSLLRFLIGEKRALDYAEYIYAYTLDVGFNTFCNYKLHLLPEWTTRLWMNNLGNKRRMLEGLGNNVDGFMTTDDNALIGVLWNGTPADGDSTRPTSYYGENREVTLNLSNCESIPDDAKLTVRRFYGLDPDVAISDKDNNEPVEVYDINAQWNPTTKTITGLKMCDDQYLLIELR